MTTVFIEKNYNQLIQNNDIYTVRRLLGLKKGPVTEYVDRHKVNGRTLYSLNDKYRKRMTTRVKFESLVPLLPLMNESKEISKMIQNMFADSNKPILDRIIRVRTHLDELTKGCSPKFVVENDLFFLIDALKADDTRRVLVLDLKFELAFRKLDLSYQEFQLKQTYERLINNEEVELLEYDFEPEIVNSVKKAFDASADPKPTFDFVLRHIIEQK